jgi:hypothetical protein
VKRLNDSVVAKSKFNDRTMPRRSLITGQSMVEAIGGRDGPRLLSMRHSARGLTKLFNEMTNCPSADAIARIGRSEASTVGL